MRIYVILSQITQLRLFCIVLLKRRNKVCKTEFEQKGRMIKKNYTPSKVIFVRNAVLQEP